MIRAEIHARLRGSGLFNCFVAVFTVLALLFEATVSGALLCREVATDFEDGTIVRYEYDADGNRSKRFRTPAGGAETQTHDYVWDKENRLTQVHDLDQSRTWDYRYDHQSQRVLADDGVDARHYVYAGDVSIQVYRNGTGSGVPGVSPEVEYIRGLDSGGGVGGLLYSLSSGGTPRYAHANHRGDVLARFGGGGTMDYEALYGGFGEVSQSSGTNPEPFGPNSKEVDETGLVYYGHRYFDPEAGVWLSWASRMGSICMLMCIRTRGRRSI